MILSIKQGVGQYDLINIPVHVHVSMVYGSLRHDHNYNN